MKNCVFTQSAGAGLLAVNRRVQNDSEWSIGGPSSRQKTTTEFLRDGGWRSETGPVHPSHWRIETFCATHLVPSGRFPAVQIKHRPGCSGNPSNAASRTTYSRARLKAIRKTRPTRQAQMGLGPQSGLLFMGARSDQRAGPEQRIRFCPSEAKFRGDLGSAGGKPRLA